MRALVSLAPLTHVTALRNTPQRWLHKLQLRRQFNNFSFRSAALKESVVICGAGSPQCVADAAADRGSGLRASTTHCHRREE